MENSAISWTDHTWNCWVGCSKVSSGCKNCYAEEMMVNRFKTVQWGNHGERKRTSDAMWRKPVQWNSQLERGHVHRCKECDTRFVSKHSYCAKCNTHNVVNVKRERVFCASLADIFEKKVNQDAELNQWRSDAIRLMADTPNLDWLVLTKRPENIYHMLEEIYDNVDKWLYENPHIAFGTSIENQAAANYRMHHLMNIPAKTRFLSVEPMIGEISLRHWKDYMPEWVIIGGESGKSARPLNIEWVNKLISECIEFDVLYFVKQLGDNPFLDGKPFKAGYKGHDMDKWPRELRVRQYPE